MTLSETEFFCVKCRSTVKLQSSNISVKVYKNARFVNGSPALVGKCKCGTNVTKFIRHDDKDKLEKKYGTCKSTASKSPKKKTVDKKCVEKCVKKCTK
jgi:hypothetical protein